MQRELLTPPEFERLAKEDQVYIDAFVRDLKVIQADTEMVKLQRGFYVKMKK